MRWDFLCRPLQPQVTHKKRCKTPFLFSRYNDFKHDPLSRCNCSPPYTAQYAISARSDLNDPNGQYPIPQLSYRLHGATDVKLVNWAMARDVSYWIYFTYGFVHRLQHTNDPKTWMRCSSIRYSTAFVLGIFLLFCPDFPHPNTGTNIPYNKCLWGWINYF